jgi:hypothetical protein
MRVRGVRRLSLPRREQAVRERRGRCRRSRTRALPLPGGGSGRARESDLRCAVRRRRWAELGRSPARLGAVDSRIVVVTAFDGDRDAEPGSRGLARPRRAHVRWSRGRAGAANRGRWQIVVREEPQDGATACRMGAASRGRSSRAVRPAGRLGATRRDDLAAAQGSTARSPEGATRGRAPGGAAPARDHGAEGPRNRPRPVRRHRDGVDHPRGLGAREAAPSPVAGTGLRLLTLAGRGRGPATGPGDPPRFGPSGMTSPTSRPALPPTRHASRGRCREDAGRNADLRCRGSRPNGAADRGGGVERGRRSPGSRCRTPSLAKLRVPGEPLRHPGIAASGWRRPMEGEPPPGRGCSGNARPARDRPSEHRPDGRADPDAPRRV